MAELLRGTEDQREMETETETEHSHSELEQWAPRELAVAGFRVGRRALTAVALLGAAAVAVMVATSFSRSPEAVEVHYGQPLSPLEMEEINSDLQELQETMEQHHGLYAPPQAFMTAISPATTTEQDMANYRRWAERKNCRENEELFMGLCYKKCSLLTSGVYPFRSSGWGCCKSKEKCGLTTIKVNVGICSGFSVSGDGVSCPRQMGFCLQDEELFLGLCYKKCSILTDENYPFRVTPLTCCKMRTLACLHPSLSDTSFGHFGSGNFSTHETADINVSYEIPHPPLIVTSTDTSTTQTSTTMTTSTTTMTQTRTFTTTSTTTTTSSTSTITTPTETSTTSTTMTTSTSYGLTITPTTTATATSSTSTRTTQTQTVTTTATDTVSMTQSMSSTASVTMTTADAVTMTQTMTTNDSVTTTTADAAG